MTRQIWVWLTGVVSMALKNRLDVPLHTEQYKCNYTFTLCRWVLPSRDSWSCCAQTVECSVVGQKVYCILCSNLWIETLMQPGERNWLCQMKPGCCWPVNAILSTDNSILHFSRRSYPERLPVASACVFTYVFVLVPRGNRFHNPGVASAMLNQLSHTGPKMQVVVISAA